MLFQEDFSSPDQSPEHDQPIFIQPTSLSEANASGPGNNHGTPSVDIELSEKSTLSTQGQVAYGADFQKS